MIYQFEKPMYTKNLTSVRMYCNGVDNPRFKIVCQNVGRNSVVNYGLGINVPEEKSNSDKGTVNQYKLFNNISRAKSKILDYGYSNHWEYFFTQTIDKRKYDRENLNLFIKDFTQSIRDVRKKYDCDFKYLIIPELHKDGKSWHIHGLLADIPEKNFLKQFDKRRKLPLYIKNNNVLNCPLLEKKYGFNTFEPIRDSNKSVSYITKYITKELSYCVSELNYHMYYSSTGLNTSDVLARGVPKSDIEWDFENDYCHIKWIDDIYEVQKIIDDLEKNV